MDHSKQAPNVVALRELEFAADTLDVLKKFKETERKIMGRVLYALQLGARVSEGDNELDGCVTKVKGAPNNCFAICRHAKELLLLIYTIHRDSIVVLWVSKGADADLKKIVRQHGDVIDTRRRNSVG